MCFFICLQILIEFCAGGAVDAVMLGKCLIVPYIYILNDTLKKVSGFQTFIHVYLHIRVDARNF